MPSSVRIVLVFPEPLEPRNAKISPRWTSNERPSTIDFPPRRSEKSSTRTAGAPLDAGMRARMVAARRREWPEFDGGTSAERPDVPARRIGLRWALGRYRTRARRLLESDRGPGPQRGALMALAGGGMRSARGRRIRRRPQDDGRRAARGARHPRSARARRDAQGAAAPVRERRAGALRLPRLAGADRE